MNASQAPFGNHRRLARLHAVLVLFLLCGCGLAEPDGLSPAATAVLKGDIGQLEEQVEEGADVNAEAAPGVALWHLARIRGYEEIVAYLHSKGARTNAAVPSPQTLADVRLERFSGPREPALAVLVARDGEALYSKAVGMADIKERIEATPETRFRIGSVTKQFTAAAILRLQEQARLKLTDTLEFFFPGYPGGTNITLHHLLTHSSGLFNYTAKGDFMTRVVDPVKPEEVVAYFRDDPAAFAPGEKWAYCNSGYFLLGEIVARAGGKSYAEFLREEFFAPLQMEATGVHERGRDIGPEALGYSAKPGGGVERAVDWHMSWAGGAGALYSTTGDLMKWNEALHGGELLTGANLELMRTAVKVSEDIEPGPKDVGYGYGLLVGRQRGLRTYGHGGGLNGFSSSLAYFPESKLSVVVLSAALPGPDGLDVAGLGQDLAEYFLWQKLEPREVLRTDPNVDSSTFERFTGRYDYKGAIMSVTTRDNRLFAQLTSQPEYEIFPRSATEFYWKVTEASVTFLTNAAGEVTGARHRQGGAEFNVKRLGDVLALPPERLDDFVGSYDYGQGAIMKVTRKGGRLYARLTGQPRLEIVPITSTNFVWRAVDAAVTFVRNERGAVIKGIHEQGGRRFEVAKVK